MRIPVMLEPEFSSYAYGSPTPEIITLAEAKAHCRVDTSDDDAYLTALIDAVVTKMDGYNGDIGRALLSQTWVAKYNYFGPERKLRLPLSPVQSAAVSYYDADNVLQVYSSNNYDVYDDAVSAFLWRNDNVDSWPTVYNRLDAVQVTMVVGYGDTAASIPQPIIHAMKLLLGHWYENREQVVMGQAPTELPMAVEALINNYRRHRFGY